MIKERDEGAWKRAVVQDQRELGLIGAGMSGTWNFINEKYKAIVAILSPNSPVTGCFILL